MRSSGTTGSSPESFVRWRTSELHGICRNPDLGQWLADMTEQAVGVDDVPPRDRAAAVVGRARRNDGTGCHSTPRGAGPRAGMRSRMVVDQRELRPDVVVHDTEAPRAEPADDDWSS